MATHSSVLAWRIPGTVGPGGLSSMGLHDWSDLAAVAAAVCFRKWFQGTGMEAGESEPGKGFKSVQKKKKKVLSYWSSWGRLGLPSSRSLGKLWRICFRTAHLNNRREQHLFILLTHWSRVFTLSCTQAADIRFPYVRYVSIIPVLWLKKKKCPRAKSERFEVLWGQIHLLDTC